jgi:hypothetical protein
MLVIFLWVVVIILTFFLFVAGYYWIMQIRYGINPKRMVFVPTFLSQEVKNSILATTKKYISIPSQVQLWEPGCGIAGTCIWLNQELNFQKTIGIEVDGLTFLGARLNKWFRKSNIELIKSDFFELKPPRASLIYCYLGNTLMSELYKQGFFKNCLVFSLTFPIIECQPTETINLNSIQKVLLVYDFRL